MLLDCSCRLQPDVDVGWAPLTGLLWLVSSAVAGALAGELLVELVELFGDAGMVRQPGVPVDTGAVGTVSQPLHFGVELIGHGLPVPSPSLLRQLEGGLEGGDSPAGFASPPNARFIIDRLSLRRPQVGLGGAYH